MIDIDSDSEKFEQILKDNIIPTKPEKSIIEALEKMKVSSHWFLDENYSDEFEELIENLKKTENLDLLVEKYFEKVFYPEETVSWIKKLLMSAYIKYSIGKDDEAELIYGLTEDKLLITELLKNILKRSIYEYLTKIKYDKNANAYNFTNEEIDDKISYIEENWVQHV